MEQSLPDLLNQLETIRQHLLSCGRMKQEALRKLIELSCRGPKKIRPLAMDLLLAPPTTEEIPYYRTLRDHLARTTTRLQDLPLPILEFLLNGLAMNNRLPSAKARAHFFRCLMKKLSSSALQEIFSLPYPAHLFLCLVSPKALTHGTALSNRRRSRMRWRLLKKRLGSLPTTPPPWAETTLKDLAPLRQPVQKPGGTPRSGGTWLLKGRTMAASPVATPFPQQIPPLRHAGWNGLSRRKLEVFDRLLEGQKLELQAIRNLAREVSLQTRRVVLSLHNATLAAAGGWAHDSLSLQFPHRKLLQAFDRETELWAKHLQQSEPASVAFAEKLEAHWQQRILQPRVLQCLWESRVRYALDDALKKAWLDDLRKASSLFPPHTLSKALKESPFGWPGLLAPHQRLHMGSLWTFAKERQEAWVPGLLVLAGLAQAGDRLLRKGDLGSLVIPWIDKFFISSQRRADKTYLSELVEWLGRWAAQPLILLWEDSARPQSPSFSLALQELREAGRPFRGIGMFDDQASSRKDAMQIICSEHRKVSLFALRPFSDTHNPGGLAQILDNPDPPSSLVYDSAWKDDLCFLYAGTQIAPLVSIQTDVERWSPWVVLGGKKRPFGQYLRSRLRSELGLPIHFEEKRDVAHARWANLE